MATELIRDYLPDQAAAWDDLVARAVNGTMLHTRRYLSYHGDRFRDRSLLITNSRGWPIGALPAAEDPADASVVTSHPGLSYGGLVHDGSLRGESMMRVLSEIAAHYRALGFARVHYKALPQIYQAEPAADDVHALYRLGASQSSCDLAAVINLAARGRVASSRRQRRRRAEAAGVQVDEGWKDAPAYWQVLEANLGRRHGATPTHSLAEIDYLHDRFPKEIILITAKIGDHLVGGNLFTAEGPVLQVRYTATTEAGRDACATDLVVERGIALAGERGCRYFSFGTSTLDAGRELNAPQYDFKVSFGAGGVTHDAYELSLEDAPMPGHPADPGPDRQ
ncbi:MAG TPA: GNAT family N-acetyltransferase [Streptosporangiaceae bacterium]|nr:GNAT family N-acetyltransferase [Streptosporangiaceae bacterium]